MQYELPDFYKFAEMLFECISAGAGRPDHIRHRHASVLASKFEDADGQFRECGQNKPLALNFHRESALLLLQRT